MSKIKKKYIRLGTGTDELNSQDLPANLTPSNYTPAQVGSEGTDKVSAHLNGIDTAIGNVPQASLGDISESIATLANNQASAANVTGFLFSASSARSFEAHLAVYIDATTKLYEFYKIYGILKDTTWHIALESVGDDSGVTFSMSGNQLQYTSENYTGFVSGRCRFRVITTQVND